MINCTGSRPRFMAAMTPRPGPAPCIEGYGTYLRAQVFSNVPRTGPGAAEEARRNARRRLDSNALLKAKAVLLHTYMLMPVFPR